VKQAYDAARAAGTAGPVLHRLFQKSFRCAKLIRSTTHVNGGQASVGSVVVALARRVLGEPLGQREALLWGAGKAAEVTARHLVKAGIGRLWVVNRTQAKAEELAQLCSGGWVSWERAREHLAHVDIAIVCTQAPHYVLDDADLSAIVSQRGSRPLLLVDLAVPRNVDPALAQRPGISVYNIDDLQAAIEATQAQRRDALASCEWLVQRQVGRFQDWWQEPDTGQEVTSCRPSEICSPA
jgi:glutamyl-tRNA reductase